MNQNHAELVDVGDQPDWHLLMEKLANLEARLIQQPKPPPSGTISDTKLAVIATSIYRARRRRRNYFDDALFAEPAWDMLLDLFVNRARGRRVNVTSLCIAANVPATTALRWIGLLEQKGLATRRGAPEDRRVILVDLTPAGYKQMRRYVVDGIGRFDMPMPD